MRWLATTTFYLKSLFTKRKLEAQMAEEIRAHVELATEANVAAGMSPTDARHAALREFGNVASIQERTRDEHGWLWLEHLRRDLRQGWRMIRKTPGTSTVVVISLAIAIGVNAVVFSWMRGLVFRPLPGVPQASELLLVEPRSDSGSYPGASWPEYLDLQDRLTALEGLLAYRMVPLNFGLPGHEERTYAQLVSGNYFQTLGLRPALGRFFHPEESVQPGAAPVVVLSHDFWQNHFAGDAGVIGQEVRLNERPCTIIGIAPEGFRGTFLGLTYDLWLPATMAPVLLASADELERRDLRGYSLLARPRPGEAAAARVQLAGAMRDLAVAHPETNTGMQADLLPFWRAPRGAGRLLLGGLSALQGMMVLVLFVICANAANLLLARATSRRREIGVRLALGARPRQIFTQVLVESLLLGLLATIIGFALAWWGTDALRAVPLPSGFPFKIDTRLEWEGLAFTSALGLGCTLAFGLLPAVQAARIDAQLLVRVARGAAGQSRVHRLLVALEVALALLVLVTASLSMRSFLETRQSDPGFKVSGVLLGAFDLAGTGSDRTAGLQNMDELLRRLKASPGVTAAAIASWVPLDFHAMPAAGFKVDGRASGEGDMDRALSYAVTPGYFLVMGLPLVAGHDFAGLLAPDAQPQAIVNEEFARHYFGSAPALGHKLVGKKLAYEIVGVVRNSLYETFGEHVQPMVYLSYRDRYVSYGQIHVRVQDPAAKLAPNLGRMVREINPAITLYDVRTLSEHVDKNLFFRRIPARMFAFLGPLVLLLAAVGIYAVVAYAVAQRTAEIGIRLALGASGGQVAAGIVRENLRVVWLGLVPAWLLAVVVMLHMRGGVLNATVLLGVPALIVLMATVASWLPARRAAKVDPMIALRTE